MNQKIKKQFMSFQYKQDIYNMTRLLKKHDWLSLYLFDQYDCNWLIVSENISYDD